MSVSHTPNQAELRTLRNVERGAHTQQCTQNSGHKKVATIQFEQNRAHKTVNTIDAKNYVKKDKCNSWRTVRNIQLTQFTSHNRGKDMGQVFLVGHIFLEG